MTLYQISFTYRADAAVLRTRISELRAAARAAQDREEAERLKRRIADLQVLRRQSSELAELTKRYYERNYHRDERYTLSHPQQRVLRRHGGVAARQRAGQRR